MCTICGPRLDSARVLFTGRAQQRLAAARLARARQTARVQIARDELRRIRELAR
jgi:hypothetical protein